MPPICTLRSEFIHELCSVDIPAVVPVESLEHANQFRFTNIDAIRSDPRRELFSSDGITAILI